MKKILTVIGIVFVLLGPGCDSGGGGGGGDDGTPPPQPPPVTVPVDPAIADPSWTFNTITSCQYGNITASWNIYWTDNSDNEEGFKLHVRIYYVNGSTDMDYVLPANTETFTSGTYTLEYGMRLDFSVKAYNSAGESGTVGAEIGHDVMLAECP